MFGKTLDFEQTFAHDAAMHRTYVRRRLTALATGLMLVIGLSGTMAQALGTDGTGAVLVSSRTYVVRTGDSMWSIASGIAPGRDPRPVILELETLNGIRSGDLAPGQVLDLPPA
jgi:hypothetical protein